MSSGSLGARGSASLRPGASVEVYWHDDRAWYSARVSRVSDDGMIYVSYADGDTNHNALRSKDFVQSDEMLPWRLPEPGARARVRRVTPQPSDVKSSVMPRQSAAAVDASPLDAMHPREMTHDQLVSEVSRLRRELSRARREVQPTSVLASLPMPTGAAVTIARVRPRRQAVVPLPEDEPQPSPVVAPSGYPKPAAPETPAPPAAVPRFCTSEKVLLQRLADKIRGSVDLSLECPATAQSRVLTAALCQTTCGRSPLRSLHIRAERLRGGTWRRLGTIGARAFAFAIKDGALARLRALDMRNNALKDEGCKVLLEALCGHSHLETLVLSHNILTDKAAPALAAYISECRPLRHLDLSRNELTGASVDVLLGALSKRAKKLERLDILENRVGDRGLRRVAAALQPPSSPRKSRARRRQSREKPPTRRRRERADSSAAAPRPKRTMSPAQRNTCLAILDAVRAHPLARSHLNEPIGSVWGNGDETERLFGATVRPCGLNTLRALLVAGNDDSKVDARAPGSAVEALLMVRGVLLDVYAFHDGPLRIQRHDQVDSMMLENTQAQRDAANAARTALEVLALEASKVTDPGILSTDDKDIICAPLPSLVQRRFLHISAAQGAETEGANVLQRNARRRLARRPFSRTLRRRIAWWLLRQLRDTQGIELYHFVWPVDPVAQFIPQYPVAVKTPLALEDVRARLEAGSYGDDLDAFADDVRLVFENALSFLSHATHERAQAELCLARFEALVASLPRGARPRPRAPPLWIATRTQLFVRSRDSATPPRLTRSAATRLSRRPFQPLGAGAVTVSPSSSDDPVAHNSKRSTGSTAASLDEIQYKVVRKSGPSSSATETEYYYVLGGDATTGTCRLLPLERDGKCPPDHVFQGRVRWRTRRPVPAAGELDLRVCTAPTVDLSSVAVFQLNKVQNADREAWVVARPDERVCERATRSSIKRTALSQAAQKPQKSAAAHAFWAGMPGVPSRRAVSTLARDRSRTWRCPLCNWICKDPALRACPRCWESNPKQSSAAQKRKRAVPRWASSVRAAKPTATPLRKKQRRPGPSMMALYESLQALSQSELYEIGQLIRKHEPSMSTEPQGEGSLDIDLRSLGESCLRAIKGFMKKRRKRKHEPEVGRKVKVYFDDPPKWYTGVILRAKHTPGTPRWKIHIRYDADGEEEEAIYPDPEEHVVLL